MKEGTTADNFMANCGGWNCAHKLIPVPASIVPKEIRDKFQEKDKEKLQKISNLIPDAQKWAKQFGMDKLEEVHKAVESKIAQWSGLPLNEQLEKLSYEIQWVENNKKYSTWEVAQAAYNKQFAAVKYLSAKENVKMGAADSVAYAAANKNAKLKKLAEEFNELLENNSDISELEQKASSLQIAVSKMEAAKAIKEAKKHAAHLQIDESNYTQERKDKAMWEKVSSAKADKQVRNICGNVWQNASDEERDAAYFYTHTYSSINEPLRGIKYAGDKDVAKAQSKVPSLTSIINKSFYDFDIWVQRGVSYGGFTGLFGIDLHDKTEEEARKLLLGKIAVDNGFASCAIVKGKGFSHSAVIYNIYCPRNTKMLYMEPFSAYGQGNGAKWDGISTQKSFGREIEMLLQRGTIFRITKVDKADKWYIDVEVIGQN
jgi:hypothetical protein